MAIVCHDLAAVLQMSVGLSPQSIMAKFAVSLKVRFEAILAVDVLELRALPSRHSSAHHAQGTLVSPASCTSGIRSFACLRAISTQANRPSTPAATTSRQRFAHSGQEIRLAKLAGLPETCIVTSLTIHVTKPLALLRRNAPATDAERATGHPTAPTRDDSACPRTISTQTNRSITPAARTSRQRFAHNRREIR